MLKRKLDRQITYVTHLIITVQYYIINYLKTRLLIFGQISFKW